MLTFFRSFSIAVRDWTEESNDAENEVALPGHMMCCKQCYKIKPDTEFIRSVMTARGVTTTYQSTGMCNDCAVVQSVASKERYNTYRLKMMEEKFK